MVKKEGRVLVIDDNPDLLIAMEMLFEPWFERIATAETPDEGFRRAGEQRFDLVLLDMNFRAGRNSGNEGLYWLRRFIQERKEVSVVLITAYGDIELAVDSMKEGALDFIHKSWDSEKMLSTMLSAYKRHKSERRIRHLKRKQQAMSQQLNQEEVCLEELPGLQAVLKTVDKVAPTDASVLLTGPNGTGKEVIAKAIHSRSARSGEFFTGVDMGALPEHLFESELFGYVKGAFTDAKADKTGRLELAHEGTLFLDEIGNLPLQQQAKLLTVLQQRQFTPVGAAFPKSVDFRLITATNKNLTAMTGQQQFREDLLYRLNTIEIAIPPLKERPGDIPVLAQFFFNALAAKYQKDSLKLTRGALEKLQAYHWPGNVRELRHFMEKTVILSGEGAVHAEDLVFSGQEEVPEEVDSFNLAHNEEQLIRKALKTFGGNISLTAQKLGINRSTLYDKIRKYEI